jgi:hypothetical protein
VVPMHFELLAAAMAINNFSASIGVTAYIDPNTGGMLFQILVVLLGVISGIFLFFSGRIKKFFYKIRRRMSQPDVADSQESVSPEPVQEETVPDKK